MLPLVYYPSEVLKKSTNAVTEITEEHKALIDEMKLALVEYNAQGIAANQLGANCSILCILYEGRPLIMVNPAIEILTMNSIDSREGCLSFPGVSLSVKRLESCIAHFLTEDGKPAKLVLEGIDAVAFQHELDHLRGVVMLDYVESRLERRAVLKRLAKTRKKHSL